MWFSVVLVIALAASGYFYYKNLQANKNAAPTYATTTVGKGDIVLSATGPGQLSANQEVSFGFKSSGKVSEVSIKLGDKVQAGEVLARLDNSTAQLQYQSDTATLAALASPSEIAKAQQAIADAQASLATAKDNLQQLIGPDLLNAQENEANAKQQLELAKAAATKDASAANQQKVTIAEGALAQAETLLAQTQNDYTGKYILQNFIFPIRNSKGVTIRRQLIAPTDPEIASAQAAYDLAKANLQDAQNYLDVLNGVKKIDEVPASSVTTLTDAQTALDQAKADLAATELIAPISGTVTSLSLAVGQNVGTSTVVTISNLTQPYLLDVNLDETDWDKARLGYEANVSFDMLPNKTYPGKIVEVYPALDDSSGTSLVHVVVQLDKALSMDLPAGATASVDVTGGKSLGVLVVPLSALKEVASDQYVVYLMKNGQPVQQSVELGLQSIVNAEVTSGLKAGDVILTEAPTN
jgi:HlyD family secretion protein